MTRVQLLSIPVSDQDRAKSFYLDTLGWELVRDEPMGPTQRWLQVRPRGGDTSISLVTWFESMAPGSMRGVVIETDDLEGDHADLKARGVRIDDAIDEAPWGRSVTFDDPDGNGFVLQASSPPETSAPGAVSTSADRDLQDAFD